MRPIVFVIPPHLQRRGRLVPSHHPIVTATLAGVAQSQGARVFVIDMGVSGVSQTELVNRVQQLNPSWVGFVPFEYRREMRIELSVNLTQACKEVVDDVQFGILNCPLHSIECSDAVDAGQVDFVVYGDSEDFVCKVCSQDQWSGAGLYRRTPSETVRIDPIQQVDWSIVSVPAWNLFNLSRYVPSAHRYRTAPVLPIFASRSCPYGCDFCPHMLYHSSDTHSIRPVADIIEEIDYVQENFGVRSIEFYDPTFGVRKDHVEALCDALMQRENPIEWTCFSRTDLWDETLLQRLYDAGCRSILFGVESGNDEVLSRTQKGIHLPQVEQFVTWCTAIGIDTVASFIIGLPLESESNIEQTIQFSQQLNPTYAQFHQARAFFDHEDWKELGTVSGTWQETSASLNGLAYVPNGFTQGDIERHLLSAYRRFYGRWAKLSELTETVQRPEDVQRLFAGFRQIASHFWVL